MNIKIYFERFTLQDALQGENKLNHEKDKYSDYGKDKQKNDKYYNASRKLYKI